MLGLTGLLLAGLLLAGCTAPVGGGGGDGGSGAGGGLPEPASYTVTYHGNDHTGGNPPVDGRRYAPGEAVTVLDNTGSLERRGYSFAGWNTRADGSGDAYGAGDTFTMGDVDVELFANWDLAAAKIVSPAGASDGRFGASVALSANTAVVGESGKGSAYAFEHSPTDGWDEGQAIPSSGSGTAGSGYGGAVDAGGDYLIVGARLEGDYGAAYIHVRTPGDGWDAGKRIAPANATGGEQFGSAVSISDSYAAVGAPKHDGGGSSDTGAVYVFKRSGTNDWSTPAKLLPDAVAAGDRFGISVAIDPSGEYLIAGASPDGTAPAGAGYAYIFRRTPGNSWDAGVRIDSPAGAAGDGFGLAVGLDGDYAVIGAPEDGGAGSGAGAAYVYYRVGGTEPNTWDAGTEIAASEGSAGDTFGTSVAVAGSAVIVGAPRRDAPAGADVGAAYLYGRVGTNDWDEELIAVPSAAAGAAFATAVDIDDESGASVAIIGAPQEDSGAAYVIRH